MIVGIILTAAGSFSNDARRGAGVPVYQANLELFLMLPIYQLLKYRTQIVSIVVMAGLQNVEMLLFRRSKGAMRWSRMEGDSMA